MLTLSWPLTKRSMSVNMGSAAAVNCKAAKHIVKLAVQNDR